MPEFGCEHCFKGDATVVWNQRCLNHLARLVDDSHFMINTFVCRECGQHCAKIFNEQVDWGGGDDAQFWMLIPLNADEAATLSWQNEDLNIKLIEACSKDRPILHVDYPTGGEKRMYWRQGPVRIMRY